MAIKFNDEIDANIRQAKAIAQLLSVCPAEHISKETLAEAAHTISCLLEEAGDLYSEAFVIRRVA